MSRVVLIGGAGFVGSNLRRGLGVPDIVAPNEKEADLTNIDTLRRTLRSGDIVVNAAGYANATDRTIRGINLFSAVNIQGVRNLAEACREAGVTQLIHISSVAAMGRWHGESITEEMLKPTNSPYASSKLVGEQVLAEYTDDFSVTILRPTSVFGENRGLAATLCKLVSRGRVPLPCGGRALIPFTYIGNVVEAARLTLENPNCYNRTFVVGDAQSYSLRDIVLALAEGMGIEAQIVSVPKPAAYAAALACEGLAMVRRSTPLLDRGRLDTLTCSVSYSIRAFQEATGYKPPFSMEEAAAKIASWYLAEHRQVRN